MKYVISPSTVLSSMFRLLGAIIKQNTRSWALLKVIIHTSISFVLCFDEFNKKKKSSHIVWISECCYANCTICRSRRTTVAYFSIQVPSTQSSDLASNAHTSEGFKFHIPVKQRLFIHFMVSAQTVYSFPVFFTEFLTAVFKFISSSRLRKFLSLVS
jgi:hypothetical protein